MHSTRWLMCAPAYFGVDYVINPWMKNQVGRADILKAQLQWSRFCDALSRCSEVHLLEPRPGVPDLVFTANAGIVSDGAFIPSRFLHQERQAEEPFYKAWFKERGVKALDWPEDIPFEGAGDALFQPGKNLLWLGHGFRTDVKAVSVLQSLTRAEVVPLALTDPRFYHLDTCFCPLRDGQAMYYPGAFDEDSLKRIEAYIQPQNRIEVSNQDAEMFACNAVLDEDRLFMNSVSISLRRQLVQRGYLVDVVPVTEFLKSGGANRCLTMSLEGMPLEKKFDKAA